MEENIKRGQVIKIKNKEYTVTGMIEFSEDTWKWKEYKLTASDGKTIWLSIEKDENGKYTYSIYNENYSINKCNGIKITYNNEEYELYEQGTSRVDNYFGKVDVDRYETCSYREYISQDKKKMISIEDWDGEIEKSYGEVLKDYEIEITEKIDNNVKDSYLDGNKTNSIKKLGKKNGWVYTIILLIAIIPIFMGFYSSNNSVRKFLDNSSNFTYKTSVTNNQNNKKARVYKTSLSVDEAVKKIIDGVSTKITKVTEEKEENEDGIGLFTNSEYVYVYTSEENTTYVQVSSKKYVTSNTNAYKHRGYYSSNHYYRTYSSNNTSSKYSSYLSSARQSSVSSRTSSGGGLSAGK